MKTLFKNFQKEAKQLAPANQRICLTRTFIETGDERCPLAGIWSQLPEMNTALDDEPGLPRPAWGVLLDGVFPWRAFYFRFIDFCYRTA